MDINLESFELDEEEFARKLEEERVMRLAMFAESLAKKRKEAIEGRQKSGCEIEWQEDSDYYEGIDEANAHQRLLKPATMDGSPFYQTNPGNNRQPRSNVFVNITQPYCDMASARVSDMLLPTDDKAFSISPTPIPDVGDSVDSTEPMPGGQHTVGDAAKLFLKEAKDKADKAETQIWDWLVESGWHSEKRKVIEQGAKIGTGVLKGPYPIKRKARKVEKSEDGSFALTMYEETKPATTWIDSWNFYPDPSCGNNIQNGNYTFERDSLNARQLRELKGGKYIDSQIDLLLKEGPNKKYEDGRGKTVDSDTYEVWYYHGTAETKDMESTGCECDKEAQSLSVIVTMVNDRIIKASLAPLDDGSYPYDVFVWQRKADHWTGIGVGRQVRTAQRIVNAAMRNMMDNAGVAGGPQIIALSDIIYPLDGEWTITPLKLWGVSEGADIAQAAHAMTSVIIPMLQKEMEAIVKLGMEIAERATSMPLLLQGQQGASTETVGGMTILNANASTVLRRIAKIDDDDVTIPHINRYYQWLMMYSEDNAVKGDYQIVAKGSSSFYERDAQNQSLIQLLPMSVNPAFGLNPKLIMQEYLRAQKINPERVSYTDEEAKQMQEAAANQPQDPRIEGAKEVATIKVQGDMQKAQLSNQSEMAEIEAKKEATQSEFALKLQMQQEQQQHERAMKEMELQVKMMEFANSKDMALDQVKAQLAQTSQKLNTQKELSYAGMQHKEALSPPTEPAGKAAPGRSFQE